METRGPQVETVGSVGSVGNYIKPQLTVSAFNCEVHIAFGRPDAVPEHEELEMIDQPLDRRVGLFFGRNDKALVRGQDIRITGLLGTLQVGRKGDVLTDPLADGC